MPLAQLDGSLIELFVLSAHLTLRSGSTVQQMKTLKLRNPTLPLLFLPRFISCINSALLDMTTRPPLDPLGDCVVCGTRTPTRCSECASNGT